MNIVVLAGGLSPERDVSLSSGSLISNALMKLGHSVLMLDVYEGLEYDGSIDELFRTDVVYKYEIKESEPDLNLIRNNCGNQIAQIGKNVLKICEYADVVFIALHGSMGENGQIQATFDNFGIVYTGSGYIGSLLAMNKELTKRLLVNTGIVTAEWISYDFETENINSVEKTIGYPCVVKPCSCGSSVGVSIVNNHNELEAALRYAGKYEESVLVEKKINGREFSVGILDGKALPPIEIVPLSGFYDYKNKYQGGLTREITPADLSSELTNEIQQIALQVHKELKLGGYSRIDFILDSETEKFVCLEANTLPGMTPISLLPQEAAAVDISYPELCNIIVNLPFKHIVHKQK